MSKDFFEKGTNMPDITARLESHVTTNLLQSVTKRYKRVSGVA